MDTEMLGYLRLLGLFILVLVLAGMLVYLLYLVVRQIAVRLSPKIFISYRRSDSADVTGRIYEHLAHRFSKAGIFLDVSSIPPAADFPALIQEKIAHSRLMLVIIGPQWASITGQDGERRLTNPSDFVHQEVAGALAQPIPVIPVLVSGAEMPGAAQLPDDLKALATKNAVRIRPEPDFKADITNLIHAIQQL
ncbi:MAG: toll/interleukin-1 receptor domain-containing protein [Anaerolineales bacterium]|nr:toll/interleukin-1 receptor domain-containing protein [Anaerolineales bacterium]